MRLICLFLPESQQGALGMECGCSWRLGSGLIHFTPAFPLSRVDGSSEPDTWCLPGLFWPSQTSPLPCPLFWVHFSCFLSMFALVVYAFPLVWWGWDAVLDLCWVLLLGSDTSRWPSDWSSSLFPCPRRPLVSVLIFSTIAAYLFLILTCCLWIVHLFVQYKSNFILLMLEGCYLCLLT